ncbi:MAG TPA: serine/threonine-protein kinase, partial [Polyangiaceae bacterium]|nr:serine/threonine-protein kinase [Polyangiaceae bacterium]
MTRDARVAGCFALPPAAVEVPIVRHGAGSVLCGKYRLDALLGEGAMGSVWRATNLLLDAPVAIKLIRADLDGGEFRERLQLEARAAAGLGHPAIVRVFDIGETAEGDPFIVMELLRGETLTRMLAAGPLSPVRAAQLVLPVVDALATTHARGIVHRDLKPDNLLIASEAQRVQPKIVDFGIAKLNNGGRDLDESGGLVGSPEYMSPEQANGRDDVDYRTDIWSICVVLYEATAGMMPFSAPTTLSLLRTIIEEEPVPLVHLASVDEQFWDILRTGLAKDRFARHDSMSALGRALAAWLLGQGVTEDVCGTSIEPKWFGETSDPATLRDVVADDGPIDRDASTRPPALRRTLRPKASAHRGFAARILPRRSRRRRALHAAVFACALVTAAAVVYVLPSKHGSTSLAAVS